MTATAAQLAQSAAADPFYMYPATATATAQDGSTRTSSFMAHIACDEDQLVELGRKAINDEWYGYADASVTAAFDEG